MKDRYYFRHDYNARNDDKIEAMLLKYKAEGYGLFWCIVERLHEENNEIRLNDVFYASVAKQMLTDVERVLNFVNDCSTAFQLFTKNGDILSADRVSKNLDERKAVKLQRSIAGQKSALSRRSSTGVELPLTVVEQRKGKERKGNNNIKGEWIEWGKLIVAGNDQYWEQMRGRNVAQPEMDKFIALAVRNNWTMDSQQDFRITLHGTDVKSNGTQKNKYKIQ